MGLKNSLVATDVGLIPADWVVKTIADISSVGRGRVISHKEISACSNPNYPVYSSQTRDSGVMGYLGTYDFHGEYITWTTDGANAGTVFHRTGRFNCTNVCGTIKVKNEVPKFVALVLARFAPRHVSRHLGNPKLMNDVMKKVKIPLPTSPPEQHAIATALSDADAYIESLEQLITKKRQIKQGVMQELLTGKRRLPGFEGEWERRNLGDVCSITTGRKDVNEGHPQGVYPFFTCSRSHTFSNSFSFDMEAILIAGNGDVGNLHYFHGKFEAYQRTYVAYDFKINTQFMWHQLNYLLAKSLGLGKVGSSIPYIKRENLTQFSFPCPATIVEQVGIASVLTDLDYDISSHEGMLAKARYLKQAMMQQLLTGKIRLV